jgi:hypothetical protein
MKNLPWADSHLLLPSPYKSGGQCGTDTSGKVNYHFNSNGYRTSEWDSIAWPDSVLVLGCSHVVGVGVNVEHSLPRQLEHILDCPVINLGYGGSSMTVQLYNSLALVKQGIQPRAVILVAPQLTRLAYFTWLEPVHMVPTQTEQLSVGIKDCYKGWIHHEPNAEVHGALQWASIKNIWQHVPFYTFTTQSSDTRWIDADCLNKYIDCAEDGVHAGPKTIAVWATEIANKVCLL